MNIDSTQNKKLALAFSLLAALGGLTAFLVYLDKKKHEKTTTEIMQLEKQIKSLQLEKLKNGKA